MTIDPVSIAVTVALNAASMALTASRKIEGPRLSDLSVTVADYGTPLTYFYGTRRMMGCPIIWAEPLKEVKVKHKTKGGKYNEYQYYGTFAAVIADHPIEAVTRIWADKHLVGQWVGPGPVSGFAAIFVVAAEFKGADFGDKTDYYRVYYGTEDQLPDPRMLATVEADHGVGSCPAYRGVSYVVFQDVPLEKFGNRIPQISIEATSSPTANYLYETRDAVYAGLNKLWGFAFSPGHAYFVYGQNGEYQIWDNANRALMQSGVFQSVSYDTGGGPFDVEPYDLPDSYGISDSGIIYTVGTGGGNNYVMAYNPNSVFGGSVVASLGSSHSDGRVYLLKSGAGQEYACFPNIVLSSDDIRFMNVTGLFGAGVVGVVEGVGFLTTCFLRDTHGDIWAVGCPTGGGDQIHFHRIVDTGTRPGSVGVGAATAPTSVIQNLPGVYAVHYSDENVDHFVCTWDGGLLTIDINSFTVTNSAPSIPFAAFNTAKQFHAYLPGNAALYIGGSTDVSKYSLADLSLIETIPLNSWDGGSHDGAIYDWMTEAFIASDSGFTDAHVYWLYLNRLGSEGVPLQGIVEDVADRVGIVTADIDASDLDQLVKGWSWNHGSGRNILEPLLDAYDSIVRPHGFALEFKKLGDSSQGTIDVSEFAKADPRYKVTLKQDTDLPRRMTFSFADVDGDQQTNSIVVQRPLESVDGIRETTIDMTTFATDVDTARQLAERQFRRGWFSRKGLENALTSQRLAIEPGDVWALDLDGTTLQARAIKQTVGADGMLAFEWKRDDPSIAVLSGTTGAAMDGRQQSHVLTPALTRGFVLDIPLVKDVDNNVNPLVYYAGGPYISGFWPGAEVYRSLDGGANFDELFGAIESNAPATWGNTTDILGNCDPHVWDRGSSLIVTLKNGTLTSYTEAQCNANPTLNMALIGNELVQFTTASLNMDGTWTISGFKRGRRGTERQCPLHVSGEAFLLLDTVKWGALGASDIGVNQYWRVPTSGTDMITGFIIPQLPFAGVSLRPYAPCHAFAVKDPDTGDWLFTWIRRTRVGGAWTGGTPIPLSENVEAYEIDIFAGLTPTITKEASSPSFTWTVADQTTDTGAEVFALDARVYQMSDVVGRGDYEAFEVLS